jgi:sucrose phosphorylase
MRHTGPGDRLYLMSRAIQFFLPGIPQVYYVGLLAGENDMALLRQTGVGRDINRHRCTLSEVELALRKPVVQDLLALIRRRNTHPAFNGHFVVDRDTEDHRLTLRWTAAIDFAELSVDFIGLNYELRFSSLAAHVSATVDPGLPGP